jgi:hypothetical protein
LRHEEVEANRVSRVIRLRVGPHWLNDAKPFDIPFFDFRRVDEQLFITLVFIAFQLNEQMRVAERLGVETNLLRCFSMPNASNASSIWLMMFSRLALVSLDFT